MPVNPVFRAEAVRQVRETLAHAHNYSPNDERAIQFAVFNEILRIMTPLGWRLRILLDFVGTLTVAIGGAGLANIMPVSATQRARENGKLKSIGATSRSILFQFLLEAMADCHPGRRDWCGLRARSDCHSTDATAVQFKDTSGTGDIHLQSSQFAGMTSPLLLEFVGLIAGLLPAIKGA
jgi:putative ABC transport system permease protein